MAFQDKVYEQKKNRFYHSSNIDFQLFLIIIWQGSLVVNPSVVIGSYLVGICHTDRFRGNGHKPRIFCFVFESRQIQILQLKRVPCNKLLINLACSNRSGEY